MKIDINGIEWGINFVSHSNEHLLNANGFCSYEENNIYIARDIKESKMRKVIIHELTHAVEYSHGLRDRVSEDRHEDLANFLMYYADFIIRTAGDIMSKVIESKGIYA